MNTIKESYRSMKCPHCGSTVFRNRYFALVDEPVQVIDRPGWTAPAIYSTQMRPEIKCTLDIPGPDAFMDPELHELIEEGYDLNPIQCAHCNKGSWKSVKQLKAEQLKEEQK